MTAHRPLLARLAARGAVPTGETWTTPTSLLAAGVLDGLAVIAEQALVEEERRGNRPMAWWSDRGGLPEAVLRDWTTAWCGLSLAWAGDANPTWHARTAHAVAERPLP